MINSNLDLKFKNTPLQNLKNILIDADTSVEDGKPTFSQSTPSRTDLYLEKTVLQNIISNLKNSEEHYITRAEFGKITRMLCFDAVDLDKLNSNFNSINKYIDILVNKIDSNKISN